MSVEQVERAPLEPDIVRVLSHYDIFPWLQFDVTNPRPQGFKIGALYLISAKTREGAFGDGLIRVNLYRVDRDESGQEQRNLVYTWQFTPEQALPYRALRKTYLGYGYQLRLRWPEDCDVVGKQICVVVEFVRPDTKVVSSRPKFLRVPLRVSG